MFIVTVHVTEMLVSVHVEIPACGDRWSPTVVWPSVQDAAVWDILPAQSHRCSKTCFLPQTAGWTAWPQHCCKSG